jgi:hypothetical protein
VTMMPTPDLLDRRALALIALVDPFGRPVAAPVSVAAAGVRIVGKREGRIAVLEAPGLAAHSAAFDSPPAAPALRSRSVALDLTPADPALLPRRFVLRLPRNPDPALKSDPLSLFQAETVELSASPRVRADGNACILRVSVRRGSDGFGVGNALVRARSADSAFAAWALTDSAGEAALVFPALPISFAGPGGTTSAGLEASVVAHVDPATVRFTDPGRLAEARRAAAGRTEGHADPDAIAAANPADFAAGASVALSAGNQPAIALQWTAP